MALPAAPEPTANAATGGATTGLVSYGSGSTNQPLLIQTTQPSRLLRHNISDEELELLEEGQRRGLPEFFWAMVAGALVAVTPAVNGLYHAYGSSPPTPLDLAHLIDVLVFFGCGALAILAGIISRRRGRRTRDLVVEIRSRT